PIDRLVSSLPSRRDVPWRPHRFGLWKPPSGPARRTRGGFDIGLCCVGSAGRRGTLHPSATTPPRGPSFFVFVFFQAAPVGWGRDPASLAREREPFPQSRSANSVVFAGWWAQMSADPAVFSLHNDPASSNLNNTSAEVR